MYQNLKDFLKEAGFDPEHSSEELHPEASQRRYFRLHFANPGSGPHTAVLCAGLTTPYNDEDHFLKIGDYLRKFDLPVPRVYALDRNQGRMLLSDGGTDELCDRLVRAVDAGETGTKRALLRGAIDLMIRMHKLGEPPAAVRDRLFDFEKLYAEMQFLFQNLADACQAAGVASPLTFELEMFARSLCQSLGKAGGEAVFTHRDYHSRNVLVRDGDDGPILSIIDFQDARMGLPYYDLASLLYDPYAPIDLADRRDLLDYYFSQSGTEPRLGLYYAQALQRLLKALGTYVHQVYVKNHKVYAPSIPAALQRIEEVAQLGRFPDSVYLFARDVQRLLPQLKTVRGSAARGNHT